MTLKAGDSAPTVSAPNQDGERVSPDFEVPTVVYFYPRDDTPGCTIEATQFAAALGEYHDAGLAIYGVSTDGVESHRAFADQEDLEFDLLADPDGEVMDAFDVPTARGAAERTTFVLSEGEVQRVYGDVDPEGHADTVFADAREAGLTSED